VVDVAGVGVPADASAVVVNVGVTQAWPGFWTAFPHGDERPMASTLNIDGGGQTRNSQAIVRLSPGSRAFDVFSQHGGHLIVDVVGYFTGAASVVSTDGLFVPTVPIRLIDTRLRRPLAEWAGSTIEFSGRTPLQGSMAAAAVNITVTEPLDVGFVTAFPAGVKRPFAANVNIDSFDQTIANHGTVRLGMRGMSLFTQSGAHLVVDVTGWYLGTPDPSGPEAQSPDHGVTTAASITAPRLKTVQVGYGTNLDAIVDRGLAALWAGSGWLGVAEHNVFFAHRTTYGGPWRNIHLLTPGMRFDVRGANGSTYVYQVVEQAVIAPVPSQLLALAQRAGQATVTLVACHPPGSVRLRYVVTARLVGAR
jgi:sortase (surface protein transpeptidase)